MFGCNVFEGDISDYRLDYPMKAKSLNFYVLDMPLIVDEAIKHNNLEYSLPKGLPYGIRTRVWSLFYPDTPFFGEMVGYDIINEQGEKVEILAKYEDFVVANVPWDDIVA